MQAEKFTRSFGKMLVIVLVITAMSLNSATAASLHMHSRSHSQVLSIAETVYLPLVLNSYPIIYPHQITQGPGSDSEPRFSPDGRTIVFISDRDGQADVFRVSVDGGPAVNLTQTSDRMEDTPVFSPDGGAIAFAAKPISGGDWDIFTMNLDGSSVNPAISRAVTNEVQPWFSLDGQSLYFSSNSSGSDDIFLAPVGSDSTAWIQLTTHPAVDRFPVLSPDGITVVFRSERDGSSNIYLMDADGSNQRPFTLDPAYDGYGELISDLSGIVFDSNRSGSFNSYLANPVGGNLAAFAQQPGWQTQFSDVSRDGTRRVYASRNSSGSYKLYVDRFTSPLMSIGEIGAANIADQCNWEAGVLAYGWAQVWQAAHQEIYMKWLKTYVDRCIPLVTISHVNDGLLAYSALVVYRNEPQQVYLDYAQNMADWLMNTAQRTPDGTLSHTNDGDGVWCDTLISVPPFLAEMSQVTHNSLYLDEAVSQVIKHATHLQDPVANLYHHAWSASLNDYFGPAYWGRGNGWALVADVAVLAVLPQAHPSRPALLDILQRQAGALKALQDSSGLWPNVVNHPDYYLETSGTAMIGYAFMQAARAGWLDINSYTASARAAASGVWTRILADGKALDVMAATGPLGYDEAYNNVPHSELQLFGQGVVLLQEMP